MARRVIALFLCGVCVAGLLGCDDKSATMAEQAAPVSGDGQKGELPSDIAEPLEEDRQATLLLNDAYSALERSDHAAVEATLAKVEKLTKVSPGITEQVAQIRAEMKKTPATSPVK